MNPSPLKMNKQFTITKVVTRNFLMDIISSMQNFFGVNLTAYERIVKKGMDSISVLAYQNPGTQRADRVYLDREAQAFIGEDTALGQAYELLGKIDKGMVGGVTNDQRDKQKNQLEQLLDSAADSIITANPSAASILVDNGPLAERSQAINQIQAAELKAADNDFDLNEKIKYTYILKLMFHKRRVNYMQKVRNNE